MGCAILYKGPLAKKTIKKSMAKIRGHPCNPKP
jgi:hypothetical protein